RRRASNTGASCALSSTQRFDWIRRPSKSCSTRCSISPAGRSTSPREGSRMREELLHYYERELTFLRRMGADFAERYPKVAGRLMLEPNKCEDPHVERMLEAF